MARAQPLPPRSFDPHPQPGRLGPPAPAGGLQHQKDAPPLPDARRQPEGVGAAHRRGGLHDDHVERPIAGAPRSGLSSAPGRTARPVPVLRREAWKGGARQPGPALVVEYGATTYVPAGWSARLDLQGNLWIEPTRQRRALERGAR